jgi:hypothetical protein
VFFGAMHGDKGPFFGARAFKCFCFALGLRICCLGVALSGFPSGGLEDFRGCAVTEGAWFAQLASLVLIAFLHVGLTQFFVGGSLSDFLVGFRIFVVQQGQAKCSAEKKLRMFFIVGC